MFAGIGAIIGTVGKILATAHLIVSSIRAVIALVRYVPQLARDLRAGYGNYSVPMAQMNMSVRMAEIMDQMKIANNRGVIAAYQGFTNSEVNFLAATQPLRMFATKKIADIGAGVLDAVGAVGLLAGGVATGNTQQTAIGFMASMAKTLWGFLNPGYAAAGNLAYQAYVAQQTAAQRAAFMNFFVGDLEAMTGGRFSLDRAYPNNSLGKPSNKHNWMVGRY